MLLRILALALALVGLALPVAAEEEIRRFISDVTVNADATMDVRETITVLSQQIEIRHGIFRDFPTTYTDNKGQRVRVDFKVLSVERDGAPEPYVTEYLSNGIRTKIGEKDTYLDVGEHTYVVTYHTSRQLGFYADHDELYWNVTGNGWQFPIVQAETLIRLPQGAEVGQSSLYTGYQGDDGRDAVVTQSGGNRFAAKTTRRLAVGEGFTIAVGWQKGIVTPPSAAQQRWWWIMDNLGYFLLGMTVLAVGAFYAFAWNRVGRDPPTGTIVPLFHPPQNLGPAGVRYLYKQKFDNQTFAAALVGLAVKKRLKIADDAGDYSLRKLTEPTTEPLVRNESALLQALPSSELELTQANNVRVRSAISALRKSLEDDYYGRMFLKNSGWFAIGGIASAAGLLLSGFLMPEGEGAVAFFMGTFASIWWGVVLFIGFGLIRAITASQGFLGKLRAIIGLVFVLPFAVAGVAVPGAAWYSMGFSWPLVIFGVGALALAVLNGLFHWLLPAPTVAGRALMDQIEGFRLYMTTAEEKRLDALHPPEKTPELFERYLPYAMALDCENAWNAKFAAVLAAAAAAGAAAGASYHPSWYSGSNWSSGSFSRDLSSGLTSAVSSASVAPGSSGGSSGFSGGGGSSGGGGGGGGGGGW
jgi:uncharacterized membrane protein YgcG